MTVNELADSIAANLGKEDDYPFRKRTRKTILDIRARLIRQEYTQTGSISPIVVQDLSDIELEEADDLACETCINKRVYRTVEEIPNPVRLKKRGSSFLFVGSNDRTNSFTYIEPEEAEAMAVTPFIKRQEFYTVLNKHIYVFNSKTNRINIRAAFGDPLELRKLKDCTGNACFTGDFQLEEDMCDVIERMIYEKTSQGRGEGEEEISIDGDDQENVQRVRR